MVRSYKYAVAQFPSDTIRNERLNIAIIVFEDDWLDVKLPRSLDKIRAISAAADLDLIRESLAKLVNLDQFARSQGAKTPIERLNALSELAVVHISGLGEFFAANADVYEHNVHKLIAKLIEPEPAPARLIKPKTTKLLSDVKAAFKAERVLALKGEGLEAHRLIANYKIAEGLPADLLLKNGAMHVIQTADASTSDGSPRKTISSIAVSALVFEQARMGFGEQNTKSKLIYKASSLLESLIAPSLDAAEHQGAKLVNWESRDDRTRFIIELSSLAQPLEKTKDRSKATIHASIQRRFSLN